MRTQIAPITRERERERERERQTERERDRERETETETEKLGVLYPVTYHGYIRAERERERDLVFCAQ